MLCVTFLLFQTPDSNHHLTMGKDFGEVKEALKGNSGNLVPTGFKGKMKNYDSAIAAKTNPANTVTAKEFACSKMKRK